jgi:hypothetical protein
MQNHTLATTLGQALADSDDITLPGIEAVIGELALHIRSVSGHDHANDFLAKVQSTSLRIMAAGLPDADPVGTGQPFGHASEVVAALNRVAEAMQGSTSPSL